MPTNDSPKNDDYMLSRGFSANTRQTAQHYLWKDGLNYLLHPSIPTDKEGLHVAEIGVGTGVWLLEFARTLSPTAQLDGLDISFQQCPPQEWQPANIAWHTVDCTAEPPPEFLEKYDIIHVQLFITIIRNGDPVPVLKNLMKMLKPGGHISWGEWDFTSWNIIRTPSASGQKNEELNELMKYTSTMGNTRPGPSFISSGWVARLHQTFEDNGLQEVLVERVPFSREILTYLLDTFMVASEEICFNLLDQLGGGQGNTARAMIAAVLKNRKTTAFSIDRVITVGQKPAV